MKAEDHPHIVWFSDHFMRVYIVIALAVLLVLSFLEFVGVTL